MTDEIIDILDPEKEKCEICERWTEDGQWDNRDIKSPNKGKSFWCNSCLAKVKEVIERRKARRTTKENRS